MDYRLKVSLYFIFIIFPGAVHAQSIEETAKYIQEKIIGTKHGLSDIEITRFHLSSGWIEIMTKVRLRPDGCEDCAKIEKLEKTTILLSTIRDIPESREEEFVGGDRMQSLTFRCGEGIPNCINKSWFKSGDSHTYRSSIFQLRLDGLAGVDQKRVRRAYLHLKKQFPMKYEKELFDK